MGILVTIPKAGEGIENGKSEKRKIDVCFN